MWPRPFILGLLLVSAPLPLLGQIVHGRVVDDRTGTPVPGARVTVLEGDEPAASPQLTSAQGTFRVLLPQGGRYRLRVEQLGYPAHSSEEFRLVAFELIEVEVRLTPQPIELAPLEVVARGNEPGREAFARRRALGQGVFLDPVQVALVRDEQWVFHAADLIRQVEGIEVDRRFGRISTRRGWRCLVVFLDYGPFPVMYSGPDPPRLALGGIAGLNELIDQRWVRAVEVYRSIDEVPQELRQGWQWNAISRCGVVWFWTEMGW